MRHLLITGPGRSGTTFLMQLLTRCGLDTGYTAYHEPVNQALRAGCEWHIEASGEAAIKAAIDAAPYVLKGPDWCLWLKHFVRAGLLEVEHVFLPVRDLDDAAASRLAVGLQWYAMDVPEPQRTEQQAAILALALGRAVEACVIHDIPYTLLHYPRLVQDVRYCYERLSEGIALDRAQFYRVFHELAQPKERTEQPK